VDFAGVSGWREAMAMTRLDAAKSEFSEALEVLARTVAPLAEARVRAEKDAAEIAALKRERDQLLARIAELEEEGRALAGITQEVEDRLDGAISEIRTALGR
jgi:predicted  nucleic acid-binding Zn-ribbon protein